MRSVLKENKEKLISDYYRELKKAQKTLLPGALDMISTQNLNLNASNANATLRMMSNFSPLFIQFLAWQRLMQLQDEVGLLDNGMDPWVDPKIKKTTTRKRIIPPNSSDRGESPSKKQKISHDDHENLKKSNPTTAAASVHVNSSSPTPTPSLPIPDSTPIVSSPLVSNTFNADTNQKNSTEKPSNNSNNTTSTPSSSGVTNPFLQQSPAKPQIQPKQNPPPLSSPTPNNNNTNTATTNDKPTTAQSKLTSSSEKTQNNSAAVKKLPVAVPKHTNSNTPKSTPTNSPVVQRKNLKASSEQTKSESETVTEAPKQQIQKQQSRKSLDNDSSKDSVISEQTKPITPDTVIKVTLNADFLKNPVQKTLGKVTDLPFRIGRCDPRTTAPQKLSLNLQEGNEEPSVKRVSHTHLEITQKDNNLYLLCLGRNGICLEDNSQLQRNQSIPVNNGMIVRVGPFQITLHIV